MPSGRSWLNWLGLLLTVLDLLILERKGLQVEMIQKRKDLHAQHPDLFGVFMKTRR